MLVKIVTEAIFKKITSKSMPKREVTERVRRYIFENNLTSIAREDIKEILKTMKRGSKIQTPMEAYETEDVRPKNISPNALNSEQLTAFNK